MIVIIDDLCTPEQHNRLAAILAGRQEGEAS
jgi:hypothetical protein